jgi:NAD dependent epimerase/dehydratase family enzyme
MLGESSEMVLSGQKVQPSLALKFGFDYQYPELKHSLESFFPLK